MAKEVMGLLRNAVIGRRGRLRKDDPKDFFAGRETACDGPLLRAAGDAS